MAGYITGVNQAATDQNNKAFELKLMNAKLEQEHQNRLSEMKAGSEEGISAREGEAQFSQGLQSIPQDQMDLVSGYINKGINALRDRTAMPTVPSGILHPAAQAALERGQGMLAHASASLMPTTLHPGLDASGTRKTYINVDKGGNPIGTLDAGPTEGAAAARSKAEVSYASYVSNLQRIQNSIQTFMTANKGTMLPKQLAEVAMERISQDNPEVKTYMDQRALSALTGEIDLTHSSRAVAALGTNAQAAYPQMTDTIPVAMKKINNLIAVGRDALDATYVGYHVPLPEQTYPNHQIQAELAKLKSAGDSDPTNGGRLQRLQAAYAKTQAPQGN